MDMKNVQVILTNILLYIYMYMYIYKYIYIVSIVILLKKVCKGNFHFIPPCKQCNDSVGQ